MRIYLAARYSRRLELCGYRDQLTAMGHTVTSRWLNGSHQIGDAGTPIGDHGEALVEGDTGSDSQNATALRQAFAREDVSDVLESDCVVSFTEPPRSGANRGSRHVEFGIALGVDSVCRRHTNTQRYRLIVVGYQENIFHWLDSVEFCPDWETAKAAIGESRPE